MQCGGVARLRSSRSEFQSRVRESSTPKLVSRITESAVGLPSYRLPFGEYRTTYAKGGRTYRFKSEGENQSKVAPCEEDNDDDEVTSTSTGDPGGSYAGWDIYQCYLAESNALSLCKTGGRMI